MKNNFTLLLLFLSFTLYSQSYSELENTGLENKGFGSLATGDLNNDGYLDIISTGLNENSELSTSIYINNQVGAFTKIDVALTPMYNSSIVLGDYNQDGFLDILLAGEGYDPLSALWKNNGDLTFTEVEAGLADLGGTNAEFRDIDNDGGLDILLSGSIRNEDGSYLNDLRLYSNEGNDTFEKLNLSFTSEPVTGSLGDYDNDGDLDLVVAGGTVELYPNNGDGSFSSPISLDLSFSLGEIKWFDFDNDQYLDLLISSNSETDVYINNEDNSFSALGGPFEVLERQKIDLQDYNTDGFVDLLLVGTEDFSTNSFISKIYDNSGTSFSENTNVSLPQIGNGDGKWFDMDNDGDLDLVLSGEEVQGSNVKQTVIYRNDGSDNSYTSNSRPVAPAELSWTWEGSLTSFSWESGSDNETPVEGLSYNLGIGSSSEAIDILFPESDSDGKRLIQRRGNTESNTKKIMTELENGIYFFKVQAIDGALAGSTFNVERFAVGTPNKPSNAEVSLDEMNDFVITWKDNANNEFSTIIEQKSNNNGEYAEIGSVTNDEVSFTVSEPEDAIYTFRVKSVNPNGESDYTETNEVAAGIPSEPTNFLVDAHDADMFLSWDDLINEREYQLERSSDNGESYQEFIFLDANTNEYLDENLSKGTYTYRIKAINENGESEYVISDNSIEVVLSNISIADHSVKIYPNPSAGDFVYVEVGDNHPSYEITVNDLTGKVINLPVTNVKGTFKINFSSLRPGIYIVKLKKEGRIVSNRIIIE